MSTPKDSPLMDKKLVDLVTRVEMRTRQLLFQNKDLVEENARVHELLAQREEQIQQLKVENEILKDKYAHLKVAKYIDITDEDKRVNRSRINKMIRDIEKCIAMLKAE